MGMNFFFVVLPDISIEHMDCVYKLSRSLEMYKGIEGTTKGKGHPDGSLELCATIPSWITSPPFSFPVLTPLETSPPLPQLLKLVATLGTHMHVYAKPGNVS